MAAIRAARIADGAFALHINVIDAANIVPRRISHGHVTVCAIPRRTKRERQRRAHLPPPLFFPFSLSLFFFKLRTNDSSAIDETCRRQADSGLY